MFKQEPQIIYEDESILVINKPAGLVVNKADTTKNVLTVQEWVEEKFKIHNSEFRIEEEEFFKRGGIVHRLDKETSGLLLIAKTPFAFKNLQAQFKEGKVEKTYIALCHGKVVPPEGEINAPIGRLPWNRTHFGILPEGRESKTFYKVINYKKFITDKKEEILSLLELKPKTGRTHQIRVHLRHLGFPIFADELYAGRKNAKRDRKFLSRHFLHAAKIKFSHPKTEQEMTLKAIMPQDLSNFLSNLNSEDNL